MYLFNYLIIPLTTTTHCKLPGASAVFAPDEKAPPVQAAEGDTTTCAMSSLS